MAFAGSQALLDRILSFAEAYADDDEDDGRTSAWKHELPRLRTLAAKRKVGLMAVIEKEYASIIKANGLAALTKAKKRRSPSAAEHKDSLS